MRHPLPYQAGLSALLTVWTRDAALFASPSFVAVYGAFSLFFGGAWPVMYVVTPASFPIDVRGAGFGLASSSSKMGQLIAPLLVGSLLAPSILRIGSFFTSFWTVAALAALSVWHLQLAGAGKAGCGEPGAACATPASTPADMSVAPTLAQQLLPEQQGSRVGDMPS